MRKRERCRYCGVKVGRRHKRLCDVLALMDKIDAESPRTRNARGEEVLLINPVDYGRVLGGLDARVDRG